VKVILPVESTEYVPTPVTVTEVFVQFGATSAVGFGSQSFTDVGSSVAPVAALSLSTKLTS
jgi:hypothetical protein